MIVLSNSTKINFSSSQGRQNRFSLEQKASFISFLAFRSQEEKPENLSRYAERHGVSRQTLYNIKNKIVTFFSPQKTGPKLNAISSSLEIKTEEELPLPPFHYLLGNLAKKLSSKEQHKLHRTLLETASSPVSTKQIKSILFQAFSIKVSKRKIKSLLNAYSQKAHSILKALQLEKKVEFIALDEIFCGRKPILVGVDLNSFAVVLLEKSSKRDHQAWLSALDPFEFLKLVVSDDGSGLAKAIELKGIPHQLDLFHFKRAVSKLLRNLESQAYKKIEDEYSCQKKYLKKGEIPELKDKYIHQKAETMKSIELFDLVERNLEIIVEGLEPFDEEGNIQDLSKSLSKIRKAAERLKKASKNKKIQNIAKKALDERLLHYLKEMNEKLLSVMLRWKPGVKTYSRKEVFETIGCFFKEKSKEIKVYEREGESRKELLMRRNGHLKRHYEKRILNSLKLGVLKESLLNFEEVYNEVTKGLSEMYRASSLVESYNSQIRIGQQVKKGVSEKHLWLSALKWNVTPFEGGKRKGKSPLELLGIEIESKDWLDLLMKPA